MTRETVPSMSEIVKGCRKDCEEGQVTNSIQRLTAILLLMFLPPDHALLENIHPAPREPPSRTPGKCHPISPSISAIIHVAEQPTDHYPRSQLKKIINQIVKELSSLGLSPALLHELLEAQDAHSFAPLQLSEDDGNSVPLSNSGRVHLNTEEGLALNGRPGFPKVVYEFSEDSSKIEPRLRISLESLGETSNLLSGGTQEKEGQEEGREADTSVSDEDEPEPIGVNENSLVPPGDSLLWTLQRAGLEYVLTHIRSPALSLINFIYEITSIR